MNLFRRLGAVLPGARNPMPKEVNEDPGGFGSPGGPAWTLRSDALSDGSDLAPLDPANSSLRPEEPAPSASVVPVAAPPEDPPPPEPEPEPDILSWIEALNLDSAPTPPASCSDISATADISGFLGSCLVDSESGLLLAAEGGGSIDLEAAAALNTQVVQAELGVIEMLQLDDRIEDILITMTHQLHLIRPLEATPSVFLYVALDKRVANLAMARRQVNKIEGGLRL